MFSRQQIIQQIRLKKSFLCIGLDTDPSLLPDCLKDHANPVMEFNRQIIDATHDLCIAYKPNTAFYECYGLKGWQNLIETCTYIPDQVFKIADAKRGDIGNTSAMYAQAFFQPAVSGMDFDAVTVAPYMGADSVQPFLSFEGKWVILLALTSNSGSQDFQTLSSGDQQLFEKVISKAASWASPEKMMFVVGATRGESFKQVRKLAPDHFLLVPGVGAQGGSLAEVCQYGLNADCGLIVNASRSILYASSGPDFADAARAEALRIREEMRLELTQIDFFNLHPDVN